MKKLLSLSLSFLLFLSMQFTNLLYLPMKDVALLPSYESISEDYNIEDFATNTLIVGTQKENIILEDDTILGSYNGTYILQYKTAKETIQHYAYYKDVAEFVDVDKLCKIQEDSTILEKAESPIIKNGRDSFGILSEQGLATYPNAIALIDTGVSGVEDVLASYSVIGGTVADDNGHGSDMATLIKETYSDAKIVSIKALDSEGNGSVADVYAAIKLAINLKVSVINLSLTTHSTENTECFQQVIQEAKEKGIEVVASAGNQGANAKYLSPANVDEAIVVGSCSETGIRNTDSNFGTTVDYNIVSDSTSKASAITSAIVLESKNRGFSVFETLSGLARIQTIVFDSEFKEGTIAPDIIPSDLQDNLVIKSYAYGNGIHPNVQYNLFVDMNGGSGLQPYLGWKADYTGYGYTAGGATPATNIQSVGYGLGIGATVKYGSKSSSTILAYAGNTMKNPLSSGVWYHAEIDTGGITPYLILPGASEMSRPGYTFAGWSTTYSTVVAFGYLDRYCLNIGYNAVGSKSPSTTMGLVLTANWTPNTYSVSYNANGGSGAPIAQSYVYGGANINLSSSIPTKSGHTFLGWSLDANATSPSYAPNQAWSSSNASYYTLYAVWSKNTYTLSYNGNGGTTPTSKTALYNAAWGTLETPTRQGYTFLGWFTDVSSGTQVTENTICTNNLTVYALWVFNSYKISVPKILTVDSLTGKGTFKVTSNLTSGTLNVSIPSSISFSQTNKGTKTGTVTLSAPALTPTERTVTGTIAVPGLTAGSWSSNFNIRFTYTP